jgi:hypothetical protein
LVLVFALDLEEVEEVGARRVDFDQILIRAWGRRGLVDDVQVEGSLALFDICIRWSMNGLGGSE